MIAHICPRYYPYIGGVETHVKEITERLVKKGIQVEVLTTDPKSDLPVTDEINGVVVRRFPSWAPGDAYYFSNPLNKYLRRHNANYEILHAHSYHALPALYTALNKDRTRLFFTPHYHGQGHTPFRNLLLKLYKNMAKRIFIRSERVISVSQYEKGLILRDFPISEEKIDLIPNGINRNEFIHRKTNDKSNTILSVGRLEEYKGMQHLVKVLVKLSDEIKINIVGKGTYSKKLSALVDDLDLGDRVNLFPSLERCDLLHMYADADLFALLSRNEAYGICVAEALASGTPCVVAKMAALSEWVDEHNCFGVDYPIDYSVLKDTIEKNMGRRVEKVQLTDWDDVSERLITSYRCPC